MKPKLTETTNDKLHAGNGAAPLMMVQPLPSPVPLPVNFPLPEKPKKEKKAKEQIVNKAAVFPAKAPIKIALVGTAPSSRMLAPYNDPTWKIWGCSPGNMNQIPRIDVWYEIHGSALTEPADKHYAPQYIEWMSKLPVPLYMQDKSLCPNAIPINKDALVEKYGPYFFTSTFAWMMADAINLIEAEGNPEGSMIMLFGIDMASREEYIIQRPGAYYFFSEGARRGIKITAPHESDIMQPPALYGYSDVGPFGRKMRARRDELKERVAGIEQQVQSLTHTMTYLKGALEDNDYIISIQGGVQDNSRIDFLDKLIKEAKKTETAQQPVSVVLPSQG